MNWGNWAWCWRDVDKKIQNVRRNKLKRSIEQQGEHS